MRFWAPESRAGQGGWDWRCFRVWHFPQVFEKVCEAVEMKLAYTTVRFAFRKDTLLAGPRMRPVIGFLQFWQLQKKVLV